MCIHCYTARIWMLHIIFCMRQSVKNCACACINIKCSFALHIFFRCCSSLLCRLFFLSSSVLFFLLTFMRFFFHACSISLHLTYWNHVFAHSIPHSAGIIRIKYGLSKIVHVNTLTLLHAHSSATHS